jgi:hypothetical protein
MYRDWQSWKPAYRVIVLRGGICDGFVVSNGGNMCGCWLSGVFWLKRDRSGKWFVPSFFHEEARYHLGPTRRLQSGDSRCVEVKVVWSSRSASVIVTSRQRSITSLESIPCTLGRHLVPAWWRLRLSFSPVRPALCPRRRMLNHSQPCRGSVRLARPIFSSSCRLLCLLPCARARICS